MNGTFLGRSHIIYFIALELGQFAVHTCDNPGSLTETGPLEKEVEAEKNVGKACGQEGHGEGRHDKLPAGDNIDCFIVDSS